MNQRHHLSAPGHNSPSFSEVAPGTGKSSQRASGPRCSQSPMRSMSVAPSGIGARPGSRELRPVRGGMVIRLPFACLRPLGPTAGVCILPDGRRTAGYWRITNSAGQCPSWASWMPGILARWQIRRIGSFGQCHGREDCHLAASRRRRLSLAEQLAGAPVRVPESLHIIRDRHYIIATKRFCLDTWSVR